MGHMFKTSNKVEKKDNVSIKIKYISLSKQKVFFFSFYLDKKKRKNMQIFSCLKNQFRHMSKKKF